MPERVSLIPARRDLLLPRDGVAAFRAALAVVMVAVADDAFFHPETGVPAGDHLAGGLVPLACAALLIVVARRLPDLVRGWLAIFAGALSIVGGATDGVRHVLVDRVSGDAATSRKPLARAIAA